MRRGSTGGSTSERRPARRWWPRPAARCASPGRPARRDSRSACARATGYDTSYLHLSSLAVRAGGRVAAGERIGAVGTTGTRSAAAPHLHFGVRDAGTRHDYRDPLAFLPPPPATRAPSAPPAPAAAPPAAPPAARPRRRCALPAAAPRARAAPDEPAPPPRPAPGTAPAPRRHPRAHLAASGRRAGTSRGPVPERGTALARHRRRRTARPLPRRRAVRPGHRCRITQPARPSPRRRASSRAARYGRDAGPLGPPPGGPDLGWVLACAGCCSPPGSSRSRRRSLRPTRRGGRRSVACAGRDALGRRLTARG